MNKKKYTPILCPICSAPICTNIVYMCWSECSFEKMGEGCLQKHNLYEICKCSSKAIFDGIVNKYFAGNTPTLKNNTEIQKIREIANLISGRYDIEEDFLTEEDFEL